MYNKIDSSIPLSGVDVKSLFFSPRLGFAWDVKGTGDTLIRGGFGMFRYHDPQNPAASALSGFDGLRLAPPCATADPAARPRERSSRARPSPTSTPGPPTNDDQQPLTYYWSLTYQQRLPWSLTLETAYVGNKARYLPNSGGLANLNYVPFGAMLGNPDGDRQRLSARTRTTGPSPRSATSTTRTTTAGRRCWRASGAG